SASWLTPLSSAALASAPNLISFAMIIMPPVSILIYNIRLKKPDKLFHDCQNIALFYDDVFCVIHLDFSAGVLGINNLIAYCNFHLDFLAVNHSAGAYRDNFRLLRFLLCLARKNDTGLCSLFCFQLF